LLQQQRHRLPDGVHYFLTYIWGIQRNAETLSARSLDRSGSIVCCHRNLVIKLACSRQAFAASVSSKIPRSGKQYGYHSSAMGWHGVLSATEVALDRMGYAHAEIEEAQS
jgi:hypothetical protein